MFPVGMDWRPLKSTKKRFSILQAEKTHLRFYLHQALTSPQYSVCIYLIFVAAMEMLAPSARSQEQKI